MQPDTPVGPVAEFCAKLVAAGDRPEAHVYSTVGHGFGMKHQGTSSDHWMDAFHFWLEAQGLTSVSTK